ncbi:Hsp20/alpha crystallin family protein [Demequina sp.]|uniref:Hsp20/alpha crystallin family protein n=1 Tax=Demequina sp. TaxID=2050685 RepID=UPI003D106D91
MTRDVLRRPVPATSPWQSDFHRIMTQFFADEEAPLTGAFAPALDVEETDEGFTLHVELPGISPDDVNLSIEENVLTIAGERAFYSDKTTDGFRRVERRFGTFHRSVRLPDRVDPDAVTAAYADGIVTVTVPKAESAKPRRIQVEAK